MRRSPALCALLALAIVGSALVPALAGAAKPRIHQRTAAPPVKLLLPPLPPSQLLTQHGKPVAPTPFFRSGDPAEALQIFTRLLPAIDAVMGVANYGATTAKAALQLLGVLDNRNVRAPLVALDDDEVAALRAGLDAAGLLQQGS